MVFNPSFWSPGARSYSFLCAACGLQWWFSFVFFGYAFPVPLEVEVVGEIENETRPPEPAHHSWKSVIYWWLFRPAFSRPKGRRKG